MDDYDTDNCDMNFYLGSSNTIFMGINWMYF